MTDEQPQIVTTTNEDEAVEIMRRRNREAGGLPAYVLVDGPGDGEFAVMPLDEAVEGDFAYRWEV